MFPHPQSPMRTHRDSFNRGGPPVTRSVLITCPPMQRSLEQCVDEMRSRGLEPHCPVMTQTLSEAELIDVVPRHDAWIIGDDPATATVFAAGRGGKLRAAVKWGVGVDNVDFEGAAASGFDVANTPGMFGEEGADIAMAYLVGIARGLFQIDRGVRDGDWPKPIGRSLFGKTVALVGYGDIGRATLTRLLVAGMRVQVYDPALTSEAVRESLLGWPESAADRVSLMQWPEGLEAADFVVLCCSLRPSTKHLIDDHTLACLRRGVGVVNVSRGPLIDEPALVKHLSSGHVAAAALEVFEDEPLGPKHPLREFPQVIFGSHNASNTAEAVLRTSRRAIELLLERLADAECDDTNDAAS